MSTDCLFCKISSGEISSETVVSTETTHAFRDVDPKAPSHVLVVPKRHVANAEELALTDADLLADLFATATEVATKEKLTEAQGGGGYRLVFNVGPDAGNTVLHLHLHVIGGRPMSWPPG